VQSFDALLADIACGKELAMPGAATQSNYEKARALLQEAAEGDDANAAAAKRALEALGDPSAPAAEDSDEDKPAAEDTEDDSDAAAEDDDSKPAATDDSDSDDAAPPKAPPAAQDANAVALQALAEVHKLRAEQAAGKARAERKRLLASRPDFAPELRAALQTAEITTVRQLVKTLPKAPVTSSAAAAAAAATAQGVRGSSQGSSTPASASAVNELDRRMGLTSATLKTRREGNALVFGLSDGPTEQQGSAAK